MKKETLDQIKQIIADEFGVPAEALIGKRASDYISRARHVLSLTLYNLGIPTTVIGELIGKDHATVIHSKKVYYNLCSCDKFFKIRADVIEKKVNDLIFNNKD